MLPPFTRRMSVSLSTAPPMSPRPRRTSCSWSRIWAWCAQGRRTVVNTGKYILMASSANFGNIFSMVLAGLILPFLPLLPIQVLLTNLIYDVAQAGLPIDNVDAEAIERPLHWDLRLIERFMVVMGPVSTLFDVITFATL